MTRRVVAILILVAGVAIGIGWWRGAASVPRDPEVLAELAKGPLRKKNPELRQALRGRFGTTTPPSWPRLGRRRSG